MSNVTQTIPSYIAGISQQPDEFKVPGQVNIATNVFPDITEGLSKRPGTRFIKQLDAAGAATDSQDQGKWFHYYRDETEQYLGQISRTGDINMWKCSDGSPVTVNSSGNSSAMATYLTHTNDQDIQTLTLNDYTYITNRTKTTSMSSTTEATRPSEAFIELKKVAYASQYAVNLFDNTTTTTVTTATRIRVELVKSSNNYCDANGFMLDHASRTSATVRCDDSSGDGRDAYAPNVGTRIFSINHNSSLTDDGATGGVKASSAGNTSTSYNYTVSVYNSSNQAGQTGRSNLYFRITTTGQSVPYTTGSGENQTTTYQARYTTTNDLLHGGEGWETGDYFYLWMKDGYYKVIIEEISTSKVQANLGLIRPTPTSFDTKTTVTAESILGKLQEGCTIPQKVTLPTSNINAITGVITVTGHGFENGDEVKYYSGTGSPWTGGGTTPSDGHTYYVKQTTENTFKLGPTSGTGGSTIVFSGSGNTGNNNQYITKDFNVSIIGNGLYLEGVSNFNVSSPVGELLNVLTDAVEDVADLPKQCKHGYVVKVSNSEAEEDDYYVKFFGNNDRDGEGVWEECAKPGTNIEFDAGTMPLQLVREANGTFTLSTVTWDNAQVGDTSVDGTNPQPSFIGKTINKMLFFRNRLVMLSDENVIMSRPGDFYNFWAKSAITFTATDPIDISCSSEYPAIVYDGIQVNSGLVLFTKNQQFMLTTDSDVLSPLTAKINFLSAYNFNHNTNPFSLGTTVGFIDNVGQHSRFMEMARVLREGEPDVIEQSKVVSELLDKDLNIVSASKENGFVALSEKDKTTLYCYKFFNTSDKRVHQAWFTWKFYWDIQYHFIIDDSLYLVLDDSYKCMLIKLDLKLHSDTLQTYTGNSTAKKDDIHPIYLDCATSVSIASNTYNASTNKTTFPLPTNWWTYEITGGDMAIYDNSGADPVGRYAEVTIIGSNVVVVGDWSSTTVVLGVLYEMEVEFPKIYPTSQQGESVRSDTRGSLVLHRNKINLGASGLYQTVLKRRGKPTFTEDHESVIADYSEESELPTQQLQTKVIPIYDRNTNTTLTLKSKHPTPLTLFSMTWEGDYTNKFYKSV